MVRRLRSAATLTLAAACVVAVLRGYTLATERPEAGAVVWQAGTTRGSWTTSNTYQCGNPVVSGPRFRFPLSLEGTSCGRNQMNPLDAEGSLFRLTDGTQYTWTFRYVDAPPGAPGPGGMGPDADARALIWQIHGFREPDSPCTSIDFINGRDQVSSPQMWGFFTCAGLVASAPYTPGESDDFKVVARISRSASGETRFYRNGVLLADDHGANYHHSEGDPWWNMGAYKWRWERAAAGGSTMTRVDMTIENMTVTSP